MLEERELEFLSQLENSGIFVDMFDLLPDIYFYVKDTNSRWITCNQAALQFFNFLDKSMVVGRTESDFFPPAIADAIYIDDQDVIQNNTRIINRVELVVNGDGYLTWVSTNKIPLHNKEGETIGLMGTTRFLGMSDNLPEEYQKFRAVIDYIQNNLGDRIDVKKLAEISQLSDSQFRKRFQQTFRLSPRDFILLTRLKAASQMLIQTDEPIIDIALKYGFTDQSYFTRQFSKFFHLSPKKYRQTWAQK